MNSLKVKNLTGISKMAYFIFACSFLDGMYTSVHVSECFDLDFAEKKMIGSCQLQKSKN
jgi:hypothetical protein